MLTKGVSIVQGNDWKVWAKFPLNCSGKVWLECWENEFWLFWKGLLAPILEMFLFDFWSAHFSNNVVCERSSFGRSSFLRQKRFQKYKIKIIADSRFISTVATLIQKSWKLPAADYVPNGEVGSGIWNWSPTRILFPLQWHRCPHIFDANPVLKLFSGEKLEKLQFSRLHFLNYQLQLHHFPTISN